MKKNKFILFLLVLALFTSRLLPVVAIDSTTFATSASPSTTIRNQQIKELKEKIATKVAELKILAPKVLLGEIKTLSDQKIIITVQETDVNIELSDDTSFSQVSEDGNKKNIKVGQLKVGQKIIVWGTFNKEAQTMTATNVVAKDLATTIVGTIKSVDKKNYQLMVLSNAKEILVDHQITTKDFLYEEGKNLQKIGFSKFSEGQTVYVYGYITKDKVGKEMLLAQRIIILK